MHAERVSFLKSIVLFSAKYVLASNKINHFYQSMFNVATNFHILSVPRKLGNNKLLDNAKAAIKVS